MNKFDKMTPEQEELLRLHQRKLRGTSHPFVTIKDGGYMCNGENIVDTEWIVHMDSAVAGWCRFEDSQPVDTRMVCVYNQAPLRRPNTFTDKSQWKIGKYGPENPWKYQYEMPLQNFETGALAVFKAGTEITRRLVDEVFGDFMQTKRRPVIRLLMNIVDGRPIPSFEIFDHVEDDTIVFDLVRDDSVGADTGHETATDISTGSSISTGNSAPTETPNSDMDEDIPFK